MGPLITPRTGSFGRASDRTGAAAAGIQALHFGLFSHFMHSARKEKIIRAQARLSHPRRNRLSRLLCDFELHGSLRFCCTIMACRAIRSPWETSRTRSLTRWQARSWLSIANSNKAKSRLRGEDLACRAKPHQGRLDDVYAHQVGLDFVPGAAIKATILFPTPFMSLPL
jgi:hypothetical protein